MILIIIGAAVVVVAGYLYYKKTHPTVTLPLLKGPSTPILPTTPAATRNPPLKP